MTTVFVIFNLYISDVGNSIRGNTYAPFLGGYDVLLLLYADELVLMSGSPIGLTRTIKKRFSVIGVKRVIKINDLAKIKA